MKRMKCIRSRETDQWADKIVTSHWSYLVSPEKGKSDGER